jgi:catechol 2,3-dioxygenase-like lactoylglutathione lyase family enzyme
MAITHFFAGVGVSDYPRARSWYENLFGRPPDMLPKADEAVWHLTDSASVYVRADSARVGAGLLTIAVDDLERLRADLAGRGLSGKLDEGETLRRLVLTDPDGNTVTFFQSHAERD